MSAKTPETDAPEFGMHHVTVVPTNFRKEAATATHGRPAESKDAE